MFVTAAMAITDIYDGAWRMRAPSEACAVVNT